MGEQRARRILWRHHGDECEAVVGEPLRWAPIESKTGRRRMWWTTGRTVVMIMNAPHGWEVYLDPTEPADSWHNPISCGDRPKAVQLEHS